MRTRTYWDIARWAVTDAPFLRQYGHEHLAAPWERAEAFELYDAHKKEEVGA